MLRCATFVTVARLHPVEDRTADHDIPSPNIDASLHCNQHLPACQDKQPSALALACACDCQWRRSTEPVGPPTRATGLNVAIDLRSASCTIDGLVGDLEKESWKFT